MKTAIVTSACLSMALVLAACSNAPQQPSDTVDDKTAESPYVDQNAEDEAQPTERQIADTLPFETAGDLRDDTDSSVDPVVTGAVVAQSPDFNAMSGRWAGSLTDCESAETAYVVAADRLELPGRRCSVAELIGAGDGSVTAALICTTGGEFRDEHELLRLSLLDDELQLNLVGTDDPPTRLVRCAP